MSVPGVSSDVPEIVNISVLLMLSGKIPTTGTSVSTTNSSVSVTTFSASSVMLTLATCCPSVSTSTSSENNPAALTVVVKTEPPSSCISTTPLIKSLVPWIIGVESDVVPITCKPSVGDIVSTTPSSSCVVVMPTSLNTSTVMLNVPSAND